VPPVKQQHVHAQTASAKAKAMTAREALVGRIKFKREQRTRLQDKLAALDAEIDGLVALRDALTPVQEIRLETLQTLNILRVDG